jgi:hypothetical protein
MGLQPIRATLSGCSTGEYHGGSVPGTQGKSGNKAAAGCQLPVLSEGESKLSGPFVPLVSVPPRASRQPFRYDSAKDASSKQVKAF